MSDDAQGAFEVGLAALRRKERTRAELADLLARRGFDAGEVESALARLVDAAELDDERFANRFAEDKRELGGWGAERIREALAARRVPEALIDAALEGDSQAAQLERARRLLARRAPPLADDSDRARALGFLTRRGYGYEVAYEAVRAAARELARPPA
ncbi:MAG TPA: regulatory protein RecX [Solirubrobacterales bacterium]|nr:regulatory protein RecX [Solirubrobacterales bacterium]